VTSLALPPVVQAGASNGPISFRIDTTRIQKGFEVAPSTSYYWLHGYLLGTLLTHRTRWLAAKSTRFGRGDDRSKAIKVWRINEAPAGFQQNWVVYKLSPDEKRIPNPSAARAALQALQASAFAGSVALEVHQFGTDIDVGSKWLAIPLRTRPGSPKRWRARNPGKHLVVVPDPISKDRLYLAERIRYRGRRKRGVVPSDPTKTKVVRDKLRRRFLLVHRIEMERTLKFYDSWDQQAGERDAQFRKISDRILKDIADGKSS
jgi:hypothetical protein